jgi:ubiquinone biosynthesis monooxygenase Coq7
MKKNCPIERPASCERILAKRKPLSTRARIVWHGAQETRFAAQDLPGLPPPVCLAKALAQQLGSSEVLLATLRVGWSAEPLATGRSGKPFDDSRRKLIEYRKRKKILQTGFIDHDAAVSDVDVPADLLPALRSDHAGETGAVCIYLGIRALARDPAVREFARRHLATEQSHLRIMEGIVPRRQRSRLLPLWRLAGWLTGALPALFGPAAVYRTVDAVESFVDGHYREQIDALRHRPRYRALRDLLQSCREDELQHREEARDQLQAPGLVGRIWVALVGAGSRAGVYLASRV